MTIALFVVGAREKGAEKWAGKGTVSKDFWLKASRLFSDWLLRLSPFCPLTAKTQGSGTDYGYTASATSSETSTFPSGSFSVPVSGTLGGGADAQYAYDSGTVSITVGGHMDSVSYGQSSNAGGVASALESAINNDSAAPASASLSGLVLTLRNKTAGTSGDVSLQSSAASSANFNPASFSAAASGPSLTGGATAGTVYSLALSYYPDGSVQNANDSATGNWTYNYDSVNRLTGGTNSTGGAVSWSYDSFGDRSSQSASGTLTGNYNQPTFLFSSNRIQGYCYDANGNLLDAGPCPSGQHQYAYDAENRLIRAGSTAYQYDAEGRRVSNGTWEYLYDKDGNAVTLLDANAHTWVEGEVFAAGRHVATYANNTTYFVHPDHLGTERARSDVYGNGCEWTATLPFGDLQSDTGGCAGVTKRLFTGKERDSESNLDYFGARYYSSTMGRWMSPDWSPIQQPVPFANLRDPQTLNLYSYVRNNAISRFDADGHRQVCGQQTATTDANGTATVNAHCYELPDAMLLQRAGAAIGQWVGMEYATYLRQQAEEERERNSMTAEDYVRQWEFAIILGTKEIGGPHAHQ